MNDSEIVTGDDVGQCFGGVEVYEKTAGVSFDATKSVPQGLVSQPGTALTRDCAALCKQTPNCAAFAVGNCAIFSCHLQRKETIGCP